MSVACIHTFEVYRKVRIPYYQQLSPDILLQGEILHSCNNMTMLDYREPSQSRVLSPHQHSEDDVHQEYDTGKKTDIVNTRQAFSSEINKISGTAEQIMNE